MELNVKGQLSYLILTCLQDRDFYGLDIITEISSRSSGKINLKKPSVYSNLTRMEKQGYISSYLKSSDFGPNRKYYSLTEKGRGFYQELKTYFDSNKIDVFRDFVDEDNKAELEKADESEQENDFFDFSSIEQEKDERVSPAQEITKENEEIKPFGTSVEEEKENKKDDAVFLSNESVQQYNQRLFDISNDFNKIKRKRSFAEDQISMTITAPIEVSNERKKANIEEFKTSLLENKNRYATANLNLYEQRHNAIKEEPKAEPVKDDAVFVTGHISQEEIAKTRKIDPPKIKIVSEASKDSRLPAPKRDTNVDPSHREILNKLYSKTKDSASIETRADAIYDYSDLKDFYETQNITFNVYQKSTAKREHNTNLLYLLTSLLTLLASALCSTILYVILNNTGLCNPKTNFLFVLLPALLILDVFYKIYTYKKYSSWMPEKISPQWVIWGYFFLSVSIVVGLNLIFGLAIKQFSLFATTLILPIVLLFLLLPIRYYAKRLILVKYWK